MRELSVDSELARLRMSVSAQCRGGWGPGPGWDVQVGGAGVGEGRGWAAGTRNRQRQAQAPAGGAARPLNEQPGLTSAPRLLGLPLWTRRQSRSAPRRAASLGLWLSSGSARAPASAPRAGPRDRRRCTMARAQALVLALTFQLCAPETETPAGKRVSVGTSLPRGVPGPWRSSAESVIGRYEPAPCVCLSVECAILCSWCSLSANVVCP